MLRALTHQVSPQINDCELTFQSREPIDVALAAQQHADYCSLLKKLGVEVQILSGNLAFPDACFVEDTAIIVDPLAIICSLGVASRRGETPLIAQALAPFLELVELQLPATVDGGDVLQIAKTLFVGASRRTNPAGIKALADLLHPLGYQVIPVETHGSLHLKSGCTAIDDETILINPRVIDPAPFQGLRQILLPPEEAAAANLLRVGETVVVQAHFPRTLEKVAQVAPKVETLSTSELAKAEGALTCLSLLFNPP